MREAVSFIRKCICYVYSVRASIDRVGEPSISEIGTHDITTGDEVCGFHE